MTDLTGGPTSGQPQPRPIEPRKPRAAEARPEMERAFATAARDVRHAQRDLRDAQESLLAAGIDTAQAKWRELQAWSAQRTTTGRETVRQHPFTSCAAMFGVGMIAGILLTRR